jgi:hypothetical protein
VADEDYFLPPSANTLATRAKMAEPCADISLRGENLVEVFNQMRQATGLNIFVNWRALETRGITRTLPITTELTGLTRAQALDKLLREISQPSFGIGYTIDDGVITVSTEEDLAKNTITRVYDIRAALSADHRADDYAKLVRIIQGIEPLTWRDNGGDVGNLRELSGQLIVTQTPRVQRRIAEELAPYQPAHSFPLVSTREK